MQKGRIGFDSKSFLTADLKSSDKSKYLNTNSNSKDKKTWIWKFDSAKKMNSSFSNCWAWSLKQIVHEVKEGLSPKFTTLLNFSHSKSKKTLHNEENKENTTNSTHSQ
jgi:hypothetical protein